MSENENNNAENQRVEQIRNILGLSQTNFGKPIGLSQTAIANLEKGRNKVTPQTKILLNVIYNTSVDFLETGEGDMFLDKDDMSNQTEVVYGKSSVDYKKESDMWRDRYLEANEKYIALLEKISSVSNGDKRNTG